ncbi:hypothetical protein AT251_24430 [Enterovibrio nigricans]|uniref:Uncharacterized protein n=1 Tax=Enterovibrio nigricans DSM 22720 TaxID=1121868 RepID=A0A1T4WGU7_9GAMM|nr:hypothetical protein AT251_24430 [Enterovibrio nigricans]SKA76543.1 hypothetical protein SAMN02745132_04928 [Enterovibrio nigricans DSM 22720]
MKKLQNVVFHQHALDLYDAVVINSKKAVQIKKNKANRGNYYPIREGAIYTLGQKRASNDQFNY